MITLLIVSSANFSPPAAYILTIGRNKNCNLFGQRHGSKTLGWDGDGDGDGDRDGDGNGGGGAPSTGNPLLWKSLGKSL